MKVTLISGSERMVLTNHPFQLSKKINLSGLGADITAIDTNRDGADYLKSLFNTRDVDFEGYIRTYGMKKETVQKHREKLYRIWNPKNKVTITFEDENNFYQIEGYPVSFPIFQDGFQNSNNTYQRFLLQMTCLDPFLYKNKKTITFANVIPEFSFPLAFTDVVFGTKSDSLIESVVNTGIMHCPIEIVMKANGTVVNPSLLNVYTGEKILFNATIENGEQIYMNTGRTKEVSKITSNGKENFYYALDLDADFLQLNVGDNIFRFSAEQGEQFLQVEVSYKERLGGI
ncbi:phage distal tail protein [Sutcliffiella horikoshii]|uniref:phage distal tail protein n=1 Tax=Sutcliffiella horikoshii TaxID=79883 RepID=UPI003CFA1F36